MIILKMTAYKLILFAAFLIMGTATEAAKILVLFTFPAKSHIGAYTPLMEELARRGHEVTVVTPFPNNKQLPNYKEIVLEDTFPERDSDNFNPFEGMNIPFFIQMLFFRGMMIESCDKILQQPVIQNLIHRTDLQFDLILYEAFATQCTYGFLHKYKAPSIQLVPNTVIGWIPDPVGNPNTVSYVPNIISASENMDFLSRSYSAFLELFSKFLVHCLIEPEMDSIMRRYFPDPTLPSITELERSASFLFLHSHPILNQPRPFTPNTIEVAGLHIKPNHELPKDLKKFLDDAPDGVIYFSLGSNARSADMPEEMRNAILKSFSKLKQKILWKWEVDSLPGQTENVRIAKWLPQNDILAHPNVKLFITHGGLMSLQEAVYFGVPLISVPLSADQSLNADATKNRGIGVMLKVQNLTEESFDWALNEVLHQSRYREAAKRVSSIFKDLPQTPLERAVFWVEYAIRHKGAKHLRSAALDLNIFQYYLLDVIALLSIVLLSSVLLMVFIGKIVINRLFSKKGRTAKKSDSEKKKN